LSLKNRLLKNIAKVFLAIAFGFVFLHLMFPLHKELYEPKYSKIYYSDDKTPIRMKLSQDGFWRFYTKNEDVPKLLRDSILTFEDKYFYKHFGVNPFSIIRAAFNNLINKSRIGASTITMQVVKIVEPKERTYLNKIIEILRAFQLEATYTKNEILNIYFNKAPYGGNIEGLRAAAYFYFNKELKDLSISEMAILTTIPKNPNINRPDKQTNLSLKRNIVVDKLHLKHLISESQLQRARKEPIDSTRQKYFFDMVQYTNTLENNNKTDIHTSIDYEIQKYLQSYLKYETLKFNEYNLYNSAVVVIENETLDIKAYIGSNDFFDKKNGGQNDGVLMKKSPGSTLKPFIYALALDEGLITPNRILLDIPINFNGYTPKNYDGQFNGKISAKEALKLSLNIPAIDLQNQLGNNSLYEMLEKIGVGIQNTKSKYGLSIAVGGIDLSLLELTKLYTILANKGIYKYSNQELFSGEASYLVSNILANGYRDKFDGSWQSSINSKKVAFKTGTSSDAKHLYTVGYTSKYTIGLWFGNFDGKKTLGGLTGSNTVSNSLIQIFENIDNTNNWFNKPKTITKKLICKDYFNNEYCKEKTEDMVYSSKEVCMKLDAQKIKYLNIAITDIMKNSCYKNLIKKKPTIVSPTNAKTYTFSKLTPKEYRVLKVECLPFTDDEISLVLNGKPIKNHSYEIFEEGNHKLSCSQSSSKLDSINYRVKLK
jgi:penicillin-binding protein 1C